MACFYQKLQLWYMYFYFFWRLVVVSRYVSSLCACCFILGVCGVRELCKWNCLALKLSNSVLEFGMLKYYILIVNHFYLFNKQIFPKNKSGYWNGKNDRRRLPKKYSYWTDNYSYSFQDRRFFCREIVHTWFTRGYICNSESALANQE